MISPPSWAIPVAIGAALIGSHWLAYSHGADVEHSRNAALLAKSQSVAEKDARSTEQASQTVVNTAGETAHAELEQARLDAAAAAATAGGLRDESKRLTAKLASCNSSVTAERQARERAATELANVLAEMELEGRGMAEAATRSRASGLACEAAYDGVKREHEKARD